MSKERGNPIRFPDETPRPFHETPVRPNRWIPFNTTPEEFERAVRRFEKYDRACQPHEQLRQFYGLPSITDSELQNERRAENKAVIDSFWLNDERE